VVVFYNYRNVEILDKKLAYISAGNNTFNICCYDPEYLKDISDRSQASAPDKPATAECSKQHDKRALM
jgi:hypothetical protein